MSQYLPHSEFNWVEDVCNFNVADISNDSDIGYILEVDLEYPNHFHDQHQRFVRSMSCLLYNV